MTKWLRNILAAAIIVALFWYLLKHRHELEQALSNLTILQLAALYPLVLAQVLCSAAVVRTLLAALKTKTTLLDMFLLHNATVLLNYLPMKFGTVFRAAYLKRHHGLSYARFGTFFVHLMLLMTAVAAAVGLVALVAAYGIAGWERKILTLLFLVSLLGSLCMIFTPLPIPKGPGRLSSVVRSFLTGRTDVVRSRAALATGAVLLTANYAMTSVRLWIIYAGMGEQIHPAGYLVLGAIGFAVMFVSFTPGALGIREAVLGAAATVLGVPLEVGILAAVIDRAVVFSFAFTVGGICALYLWRKSPGDFRKSEMDIPQDD